MVKKSYLAPRIAKVGGFRQVTKGLWFGCCRDIFGGRAVVRIKFC